MDGLFLKLTVSKKDIQGIKNFAEKQLQFGIARALTWTALDAQKEVKRELPHQFVLRNTYLKNSVRISPASKAKLQSIIGFATSSSHSTDFMELQEDGGIKTPRGKMIAVPSKARKGKKGFIRKGQKPKDLIGKPNVFLGIPHGGRPLGIYARSGHHKLTMLYRLIPEADIKQRLHLDKTVSNVVKQRFERLLKMSLEQTTQ